MKLFVNVYYRQTSSPRSEPTKKKKTFCEHFLHNYEFFLGHTRKGPYNKYCDYSLKTKSYSSDLTRKKKIFCEISLGTKI